MIDQKKDSKVTLGLLVVANIIAVVGFIWEYSLLALAFAAIGLAGLLACAFGLLWLALVLVDYLAANEEELG